MRSASTFIIINQLFADFSEAPFLRERAQRVLRRALLVVITKEQVYIYNQFSRILFHNNRLQIIYEIPFIKSFTTKKHFS